MAAMRDQANRTTNPIVRTCSSAATLTSLCADISPSSSHFFEVLYVGKVKVNQKKVCDTFIDDTLDKFRNYELEKERKNALLNNKDEEPSSCQELEVKDQQISESPSCSNLAVISSSSDTSPPDINKTDSPSTDPQIAERVVQGIPEASLAGTVDVMSVPSLLVIRTGCRSPCCMCSLRTRFRHKHSRITQTMHAVASRCDEQWGFLWREQVFKYTNSEIKRIYNNNLEKVHKNFLVPSQGLALTGVIRYHLVQAVSPLHGMAFPQEVPHQLHDDFDGMTFATTRVMTPRVNMEAQHESLGFIQGINFDPIFVALALYVLAEDQSATPQYHLFVDCQFTVGIIDLSHLIVEIFNNILNFKRPVVSRFRPSQATAQLTLGQYESSCCMTSSLVHRQARQVRMTSMLVSRSECVNGCKKLWDSIVALLLDSDYECNSDISNSDESVKDIIISRAQKPFANSQFVRDEDEVVLNKLTKATLTFRDEMRARTGSTSSNSGSQKTGSGSGCGAKVEDNRTMVFQVGHMDLRLISPDRKQVLLHKQIKDIVCCVQGTKHNAHFGFICKEPGVDYNVGYVFKCQSESVADELVVAISQAHVAVSEAIRKEKLPVLSCDHCPMVWYHKLCADIESQSSEKRVQACIFRRLELLPEDEQDVVLTKLRGAEALNDTSVKEQNELLMMLLRAHCESKQSRHVHDTAENRRLILNSTIFREKNWNKKQNLGSLVPTRHEFLNHYLGSSTIFMKAKRSLTSSFDQLLKRKGSRDDLAPVDTCKPIVKELSLPMNAALCKDSSSTASPATPSSSSLLLEVPQTPSRPRSSTISSLPDTTETETHKSSPMMNIFLKVGNSPKEETESSNRQSGSWRQAIFNTVVTPNKSLVQEKNTVLTSLSKRDKADLRALWRKAINQQVLLIRMEKENARLKARQEEATMKRIKLEYDDIGALGRQNIEVWEMIINKEARKADAQILTQAIRQGVPRSKRGEIWLYLAERHCSLTPPFDSSRFPNYNTHYEELLKQLTSQQHAILIDLGRTFPNHTYFSSPLGPGQLALYNLLKAYSLLDPDVGYCQGLSFVAGVLLLHFLPLYQKSMQVDVAGFDSRRLSCAPSPGQVQRIYTIPGNQALPSA
ncbi:TBC1 domain member 4, partial [Homalodisca vitripennis]